MSEVAVPKMHERRDPLSTVLTGVQIAQGIYGITDKMDKNDQADEAKQAADAEAAQQKKDLARGIVHPKDLAALQEKNLQQVPQGTPGAITFILQDEKGQETPLFMAMAPKIIPPKDNSSAEARLSFDQKKWSDEMSLRNRELAKKEADQLARKDVAKRLSPADLDRFGAGRDAFSQLDSLDQTLSSHDEVRGPYAGRLSGMNPYNTEAQSVQSEVNTAKQVIGKFLEGGVLRKEDEEKYAKILPQLTDTPEVAKAKLENVRSMIARRQNANVDALKRQGYDVSGIELAKPDQTASKSRGASGSFDAAATASEPRRQKSSKDGKFYIETAPNTWVVDPNQK